MIETKAKFLLRRIGNSGEIFPIQPPRSSRSFACGSGDDAEVGRSGCIATAPTVPEVEREIREAIRFHLDGLRADGLAVPPPTSLLEYVEA